MRGRKSKDEVYRERNLLAVVQAVARHRDGGNAGWHIESGGGSGSVDGWPIVWFELPTPDADGARSCKQLGHHVRPSTRALLEQSPLPERRPPGGYDGHSRRDRLHRMIAYITDTNS